ncbi:hypothetical protein HMPREF0733_10934 [Rothia dentocariosa ATCC 17931]|uniref:Uncharacterized protein n=1 Tax=Rothia dentocariosa (strain ATCC 17931 / CDC X599 / XDIA) TaxID=762948 RepID=E3H352_ROTDC|nr:hypothetical protein HMPREF0733_10934 [Rothia dentocariosa ATCC 17931]
MILPHNLGVFTPARRGDSYNYTEAFRALQTRIICSVSHNILGVYFHENLIHENSLYSENS